MTRNSMAVMMRVDEMLRQQMPVLPDDEIRAYLQPYLNRVEEFSSYAKMFGTPVYLLDKAALVIRARKFIRAFTAEMPNSSVFFAMKSNNHPTVASILVEEGLGLDVSSGEELQVALSADAERIIFSGPGKTARELEMAVSNGRRVTVLLDSFGELQRLDEIAREQGQVMPAGVRLTVDEHSIWRKFGIPLVDLEAFFEAAHRAKHVKLCGIQFHLSWNLSPQNYVVFLARLGATLRTLRPKYRNMIEFLDIGGGFWPERGEWLQPAATPEGVIHEIVNPGRIAHGRPSIRTASSIDDFASHIARAINKQLRPEIDCRIYTEPGRWICNDAMHLLLGVADRKRSDLVITDGGTNAVGWDRFETDYCPIINLSRPSLTERPCLVAGSLCTPHDIWGYGYFGDDIRTGDLLLIPGQGAYTWSLRQHFIKRVPEVVVMETATYDSTETARSVKTSRI